LQFNCTFRLLFVRFELVENNVTVSAAMEECKRSELRMTSYLTIMGGKSVCLSVSPL